MVSHLIIDLYDLDEDGEREAEEHVADHRPAAAEVVVHSERRNEFLPGLFIGNTRSDNIIRKSWW